jgi:DNA-binding transcriptional MerR regulator
MEVTMRIGTFAKVLGVSVDTVRRAERRGLLTPTRDWVGQRRYTEADLRRAREIFFKNNATAAPPRVLA